MTYEQSFAKPRTPILDFLFGRPLSTDESRLERIAVTAGVAVFGLDALSSAAYGPEAALTLLMSLGAAGLRYIIPISASVVLLLVIVYFSYRQTIAAYPHEGGSYTVASENLGILPGLLAGSALMIDYILDCAVGISAGIGAIVSAIPRLQPHTLGLCLAVLAILTLVNLRGVREAGGFSTYPAYLFLACLFTVIAIGVFRTLHSGGHPTAVVSPPPAPVPMKSVSTWLLLKAFASGCTALTGVEAVSNGVQAFQEPAVNTARRTLTAIVGFLVVLLAGVAYLVSAYGIVATPPGQPGYQSVLSMVTQAVMGRGVFYYVTMASILIVLALSANTAFADFPRVGRAIAQNCYLPYPLTLQGRRLVYTPGILTLVFITAGLLIIFRGITDNLIPLFAVGAFLAFTLSQAGMVAHWRRVRGRGAHLSMLINGIGAISTGAALCVIIAAKFTQGAWITVILIPAMIFLMLSIRRHYDRVQKEIANPGPLNLNRTRSPILVVPIQYWTRVSEKALHFAYSLSREIQVIHVDFQDEDVHGLRGRWKRWIEGPAKEAGFPPPEFVVINSRRRFVLRPILDHVLEVERQNPGRQIAVLLPELVEQKWFYFLLHNQRANAMKFMIYLLRNPKIMVIDVPWYFKEWSDATDRKHTDAG